MPANQLVWEPAVTAQKFLANSGITLDDRITEDTFIFVGELVAFTAILDFGYLMTDPRHLH